MHNMFTCLPLNTAYMFQCCENSTTYRTWNRLERMFSGKKEKQTKHKD